MLELHTIREGYDSDYWFSLDKKQVIRQHLIKLWKLLLQDAEDAKIEMIR